MPQLATSRRILCVGGSNDDDLHDFFTGEKSRSLKSNPTQVVANSTLLNTVGGADEAEKKFPPIHGTLATISVLIMLSAKVTQLCYNLHLLVFAFWKVSDLDCSDLKSCST